MVKGKTLLTPAAVVTEVTVNWSAGGSPGGNSAVGLVSTTGLYTAPAVALGSGLA
jgi:hypothetical protein